MENRSLNNNKTLGIDCTNIKIGGGFTHIIEILKYFKPTNNNFYKIIVWGSPDILNNIKDESWIIKINPFKNPKPSQINVLFWQTFKLSNSARLHNCDMLFIPGGIFSGNFRPFISMSQNMLPFDNHEINRYGFSFSSFKLYLIKYFQISTFKNSTGIIFLSNYAYSIISHYLNIKGVNFKIIPHGIDERFHLNFKKQLSIDSYTNNNPYKLSYVSAVLMYKHQWAVIKAVAHIRNKFKWNITLDLVGPSLPVPYKKMISAINKYDKYNKWVFYHGNVPYIKLHDYYHSANLCIFANNID